jgi:hypothetical protein
METGDDEEFGGGVSGNGTTTSSSSNSSAFSVGAAMGSKGFAEMERILLSILSRPESDVFRDPVDHKGLGLFDYLDIVKNPMDLNTVRKKYENGEYDNVEVRNVTLCLSVRF